MRARPGSNSQDGLSEHQEDVPLLIPQLHHLHEVYIVRGEDVSNVAVAVIPAQKRLTQQSISLCQPFKDLKQTFAVSRRAEHFCLHTEQCIVVTGNVEGSVLSTEMGVPLDSQEGYVPKRILWCKTMGFLGVIRPHHRDEDWSASL
jgi:hypothetical protein